MNYLLWTILVVSISFNIIGIWYIRSLLSVYNNSLDEMVELYGELEEFQQEIEKVYNMEVYYGDVTIEKMIKNIGVVSSKIDTFLETSSKIFGDSQ
jgi:hypothetical protein|tara:strand:+ start:555 stop:842 length:288 start_codon:yes stop_codon:yes gene_type:complete